MAGVESFFPDPDPDVACPPVSEDGGQNLHDESSSKKSRPKRQNKVPIAVICPYFGDDGDAAAKIWFTGRINRTG